VWRESGNGSNLTTTSPISTAVQRHRRQGQIVMESGGSSGLGSRRKLDCARTHPLARTEFQKGRQSGGENWGESRSRTEPGAEAPICRSQGFNPSRCNPARQPAEPLPPDWATTLTTNSQIKTARFEDLSILMAARARADLLSIDATCRSRCFLAGSLHQHRGQHGVRLPILTIRSTATATEWGTSLARVSVSTARESGSAEQQLLGL